MITGYATYMPAESEDPVEDRYRAARLDMTERKAGKHPDLLVRRTTDEEVGAVRLEVSLPHAAEGLASFARELEDSDLGYLYWETTTEEERTFLTGIEVAVMTVDLVPGPPQPGAHAP